MANNTVSFHYNNSSLTHKDKLKRDSRDAKKVELAHSAGITVIMVPYWWDYSKNTLSQWIKKQRPDISLYMK
jgi:hypothetical protein